MAHDSGSKIGVWFLSFLLSSVLFAIGGGTIKLLLSGSAANLVLTAKNHLQTLDLASAHASEEKTSHEKDAHAATDLEANHEKPSEHHSAAKVASTEHNHPSDHEQKPEEHARPVTEHHSAPSANETPIHTPEKSGPDAPHETHENHAKEAEHEADKHSSEHDQKNHNTTTDHSEVSTQHSSHSSTTKHNACSSPSLTSPTAISDKHSREADLPNRMVLNYKDDEFKVRGEAHLIKLSPKASHPFQVQGREYRLLNILIHSPSQHSLNGKRYPAEIQMIHQDNAGNISATAIFVETGKENNVLGGLVANTGVEHDTFAKLNPLWLLPTTKSYYRYDGSLTIAPCTTGVSWHVLRFPIAASAKQLQDLKKAIGNETPPTLRDLGEQIVVYNDLGN